MDGPCSIAPEGKRSVRMMGPADPSGASTEENLIRKLNIISLNAGNTCEHQGW